MTARCLGFARVSVHGDVASVDWTTTVAQPSRAIEMDELGELTVHDDRLWLPVLAHTDGSTLPRTHVLHVDLGGRAQPPLTIDDAPWFAATVSATGPLLVEHDEVREEIISSAS